MMVDWNQLLGEDGAAFDQENTLLHFGNPADEAAALTLENGVVPLPETGILQVTGDDAAAFLHGQLTNSISDMPEGGARLAGYCNPKGRLYAVFLVLRLDGGFLLLTQRNLVEPLLRRLRMFVLRARVGIEDVSAGWGVLGLHGSGALEALTELTGSREGGDMQVQRAGDLMTVQLSGDSGRTLLLAPAEEITAIWGNLGTALRPCAPAAWRLLDIRAGIPAIQPRTSEAFVPQHVNLDLLDGVSFSKGCYPGQEVVARMHYLGKPSRRMYRLRSPVDGHVPAAGDRVTAADGKHAGDVVMAAAGPDGIELLAVLRTGYHGRQDLDCGGLKLGFAELPYPVGTGETDGG
ncbi:MAG: folate-binding protein YgfZ [Ectothiorhodospiraceae bacterium]|nr:folate-binding protein YgfZ [Ectothiorhodospiraceae bacterium]